MSHLKEENDISSKIAANLEQQLNKTAHFEQLWQRDHKQNGQIDINQFTSDLEDVVSHFMDLIGDTQLGVALELGEKYFILIAQFLSAHRYQMLSIKTLDPIAIFLLLLSRMCYAKNEINLAEHAFGISLTIENYILDLCDKKTGAVEDRTVILMSTLHRINEEFETFFRQNKIFKHKSQVKNNRESFKELISENAAYKIVRGNPDQITLSPIGLIDFTWVKNYFNSFTKVSLAQLIVNETDDNKYDYYAQLAELSFDANDSALAALYAKKSKVYKNKKDEDKNAKRKNTPKKIILESITLIEKNKLQNNKLLASDLMLLKKYLHQLKNDTENHQSQETAFAAHLGLCCLLQLSHDHSDLPHLVEQIEDCASYFKVYTIEDLLKSDKASIMQNRQLSTAIVLINSRINPFTKDLLLKIDACLIQNIPFEFVHLNTFQRYAKFLTLASIYSRLSVAIVVNEAFTVEDRIGYLRRLQDTRLRCENEVLSNLEEVIANRQPNILVDINEITQFINNYLTLIKFYRINAVAKEQQLATILLERYLEIIYKILLHKVSLAEFNLTNLLIYISVCNDCVNELMQNPKDNYQRISNLLLWAKFAISELRHYGSLYNFGVAKHKLFCLIYYKSGKMLELNKKINEAVQEFEFCEEFEKYYYKKIREDFTTVNHDKDFLAALIPMHHFSASVVAAKKEHTALRHYEMMARYFLLLKRAGISEIGPLQVAYDSLLRVLERSDYFLSKLFFQKFQRNTSNSSQSLLLSKESQPKSAIEINPTLEKLFNAIKAKNTKEIVSLCNDKVVFEKHPILEVPALFYAVATGNVVAFNLLLKYYKHDSSEYCNLLSWICLTKQEEVRTTLLESLSKQIQSLPQFNQSHVEAARGNLDYFNESRIPDRACVYYAVLANQEVWLDTYGDSHNLTEIKISDKEGQLINDFLREIRIFLPLLEQQRVEITAEYVVSIYERTMAVVLWYKNREIPFYLQAHLTQAYYSLGLYYEMGSQSNKAHEYYHKLLSQLGQLLSAVPSLNILEPYFIDFPSLLHSIFLFYIGSDVYSFVFKTFQLSCKLLIILLDNAPLLESNSAIVLLDNLISQIKGLLRHYPIFIQAVDLIEAHQLLKKALRVLNLNKESTLMLSHHLIQLVYRKSIYHIEFDTQEFSNRLLQIAEDLAFIKDYEQEFLKELANPKSKHSPVPSWYYKQFLDHAKLYHLFAELKDERAAYEMKLMQQYLNFIADTMHTPLKKNKIASFYNALRICLVQRVLYGYSSETITLITSLEKVTSTLHPPETVNDDSNAELDRLFLSVAQSYLVSMSTINEASTQYYLDVCAKTINKYKEVITEFDRLNFSSDELIILCGAFYWYENAGGVEVIESIFEEVELLNRLIVNKTFDTPLPLNHVTTLLKFNMAAHKYSIFYRHKREMTQFYFSSIIDLVSSSVDSRDKYDHDNFKPFIAFIVECCSLQDNSSVVEITYYQEFVKILNKVEKKYGITQLNSSLIAFCGILNLSIFGHDMTQSNYYVKAQTNELIYMARLMSQKDEGVIYLSLLIEFYFLTDKQILSNPSLAKSYPCFNNSILGLEFLIKLGRLDLLLATFKTDLFIFREALHYNASDPKQLQAVYNRLLNIFSNICEALLTHTSSISSIPLFIKIAKEFRGSLDLVIALPKENRSDLKGDPAQLKNRLSSIIDSINLNDEALFLEKLKRLQKSLPQVFDLLDSEELTLNPKYFKQFQSSQLNKILLLDFKQKLVQFTSKFPSDHARHYFIIRYVTKTLSYLPCATDENTVRLITALESILSSFPKEMVASANKQYGKNFNELETCFTQQKNPAKKSRRKKKPQPEPSSPQNQTNDNNLVPVISDPKPLEQKEVVASYPVEQLPAFFPPVAKSSPPKPTDPFQDLKQIVLCCFNGAPQLLFSRTIKEYKDRECTLAESLNMAVETVIAQMEQLLRDLSNAQSTVETIIKKYDLGDNSAYLSFRFYDNLKLPQHELSEKIGCAIRYLGTRLVTQEISKIALEVLDKFTYNFPARNILIRTDNFSELVEAIKKETAYAGLQM